MIHVKTEVYQWPMATIAKSAPAETSTPPHAFTHLPPKRIQKDSDVYSQIALYPSFGAGLKVDPARPQRHRALVGFQKALSSARPKTGHKRRDSMAPVDLCAHPQDRRGRSHSPRAQPGVEPQQGRVPTSTQWYPAPTERLISLKRIRFEAHFEAMRCEISCEMPSFRGPPRVRSGSAHRSL